MNKPTKIIDEFGDIQYQLNGKLHRTNGPALEYTDGRKEWYANGKLHRTDGPAVERADGTKYWYIDDKRHRTDGPSVEYHNGSKWWYINGRRTTMENYQDFVNDYPDLMNQFLAYQVSNG